MSTTINMYEFYNLIVRQENSTRLSEGETHKTPQVAFDPKTQTKGTQIPASQNKKELADVIRIQWPGRLDVEFRKSINQQLQRANYALGNEEEAKRVYDELLGKARPTIKFDYEQ